MGGRKNFSAAHEEEEAETGSGGLSPPAVPARQRSDAFFNWRKQVKPKIYLPAPVF
jgi:hypothetical protein